MINVLLFLIFIACSSLAAALIADNPGFVTILWFDYRIETSAAFILVVTLLACILIILLTLLVKRIVSAPANFWQRRNVKQLEAGISELTYSVAALASSNVDVAEIHVRKVEKFLGRTPLALLLAAQIAKTRGDEAKTLGLLEQLLEYKETEYLATRSLSDSASKQDNLPKALQLAKKAREINPGDNASALAVVSLQVRLKHWHEALENVQKTRMPRKEKLRIRALIQLERGWLLLEDGRYEEALASVRSIISALPDFAPAIAFAARTYSKNEMSGKALRLINRAWKNNPDRILADALHDITSHEPAERQEKLRSKLSGNASDKAWLCKTCDHTQKTWKLHCDSCNSFDTLA